MIKKLLLLGVGLLILIAACGQEQPTPTSVAVESAPATSTPLPEQPTFTPLPEQPTFTPLPEQPTFTPLPEQPTHTPLPEQPTQTSPPEATEAAAETEGVTGQALIDLALFTEPNGSSARVGKFISTGETVSLLQQSEEGSWVVVEVDDFQGWISARMEHLEITAGDLDSLETSREVFAVDPEYSEAPTTSTGGTTGVGGVAIINQFGTINVTAGTWSIAFDTHVPAGAQYTFSLPGKTLDVLGSVRQESGFDVYVLTASGNECGASLDLSQLVVTNSAGQTLRNQNFHTGREQIFIADPC